MPRKSFLILIVSVLILAFGVSAIARAQESTQAGTQAAANSAFTYQGQIKNASEPVTGSCDFKFSLWETLNGNEQVGSTLTQTGITVDEGLFTVQLDFGSGAFNGNARWLETAVRCPTGTGTYSTLSPRQPLTSAPYAMHANEANFAWNALSADRLDGLDSSAFQQHFQNLVVVAKSGGDYTTITDALNSITTNRTDNPFTIYVAPGVYTETITMKPYVDIEGAGETATKIAYADPVTNTRTVVGADNAELRFMTVENSNGAGYAMAIDNDHASPHLTHVTINVTSAWTANYGVHNEYSSPTLTDVTIRVKNGLNNSGIYNYVLNSPVMTNITITVSGGNYDFGVYCWASAPMMTNVTISASGGANINSGVMNEGGSAPTMSNVIASAAGGAKAYAVYNTGASSPTMNNVTASASGGTDNYGVYNISYSAPMMRDITATASGGTNSTGVHNETYSAPTMINVTAMASGATYSYAVRNIDSSPSMTNVVAAASGGTWHNAGVYNTSSAPVMTNVTATASGGSSNMAVDNYLSSPVMINVTAIASDGTSANYGMWNDSSSPTLHNCFISASGGNNDGLHNVANSGTYTIQINSSQISASTSTIYQDSHYTTRVGASQIAGAGAFGGTYVCVASYNGSFAALNSACQP